MYRIRDELSLKVKKINDITATIIKKFHEYVVYLGRYVRLLPGDLVAGSFSTSKMRTPSKYTHLNTRASDPVREVLQLVSVVQIAIDVCAHSLALHLDEPDNNKDKQVMNSIADLAGTGEIRAQTAAASGDWCTKGWRRRRGIAETQLYYCVRVCA